MQTPSFAQYFMEQGFLEILAMSAGIAAGYLVLTTAAAAVAGLRLHLEATRPFAVASALTLALFVVCFTLFEAAALYLRYDPLGVGAERQGADREQFVSLAKMGFVVLYVAFPLIGAGTGYAVARRLQSVRPWRLALAVSISVAAFLALTFPAAEFENACNIGEPIVLESSC
jgi:hypothetical protein